MCIGVFVGDFVGCVGCFLMGMICFGFMIKYIIYGFGEKVWKFGIRKFRKVWRGKEKFIKMFGFLIWIKFW